MSRTPSYEYEVLHQFEAIFRDGEHKTQAATRDYQRVWENVINNPPEDGVTPVVVYRMNGRTCAAIAGLDDLVDNEECAMEIARLAARMAELELDREGRIRSSDYGKALIEELEAEVAVLSGTACAEEQAEGNGPCGACRTCRNKRITELEAENAYLAASQKTLVAEREELEAENTKLRKCVGAADSEIEAWREWGARIGGDERVCGWVHQEDYGLYCLLADPPVSDIPYDRARAEVDK